MDEDLKAMVVELREWKQRQEQAQADRLQTINNAIMDVLISNRVTVSEALTVLRMVEMSATNNFIASRRSVANMASESTKPVQ